MKTILSILLISFCFLGWSQNQTAIQKVEAAKIALITERLELTPEQAEKFWPIYREYSQNQRNLRQEFQQLKSNYNPKTASEEDNRKMLEKGMNIKERQLGLEKSYTERMQQVISSRQMMSLRKAEDDFRQMLMQRVREQHHNQDKTNQDRLRNNQNMQRKRNN